MWTLLFTFMRMRMRIRIQLFHFDGGLNPDLNFYFDADPDLDPYQHDGSLQPRYSRLHCELPPGSKKSLHGSILGLHSSGFACDPDRWSAYVTILDGSESLWSTHCTLLHPLLQKTDSPPHTTPPPLQTCDS
jgi:hypothetical protein